ncbi:MAG: hypothetical protein K1X35_05155 [Caulobacteraceae bacterium]|nr:hypothetical protein [Caulobacteraceae bacterium]
METVATYLQLFEAEAACAALRAAGIPAEVLDRNLAVTAPYLTATGIRIGAPPEHAEAARRLLADLPQAQPELPPEDRIPPRLYGRGWFFPGVLALLFIWEVFRFAPMLLDGTLGGRNGFASAFAALCTLSGLSYAAAAGLTWRRNLGGVLAWFLGWGAALAAQVVYVSQVYPGLPLLDAVGGKFLGYLANLLFGAALLHVAVKENWSAAPADR